MQIIGLTRKLGGKEVHDEPWHDEDLWTFVLSSLHENRQGMERFWIAPFCRFWSAPKSILDRSILPILERSGGFRPG